MIAKPIQPRRGDRNPGESEMGVEQVYGKPDEVTAISVEGFKSFAKEQRVEIRPLTLLAGANNSGKSSLLQPLLLLKQTLEASYDPGPLLLEGAHVRFSSADQLLTRQASHARTEFRIGFESSRRNSILQTFQRSKGGGFNLARSDLRISGRTIALIAGARDLPTSAVQELSPALLGAVEIMYRHRRLHWEVVRRRCFLGAAMVLDGQQQEDWVETPERVFGGLLRRLIHVPGLRGNPERSYNTSAVQDAFPGTFEHYVASLIVAWQGSSDRRLASLEEGLEALGLTWKIQANPLEATRVELLVARLPRSSKKAGGDLVNIADVGFGVSQALPVLVALLAAQPGQLVYLEQPELHLHPYAQQALATVIADAANRGVRVVAETHSSILLLAVRTLIVEGKISPEKVMLHWFQRDARGATKVTSAEMDKLGAYGDWPEDFGEVQATVDNRYLDAVESKVFPKKRAKR
ncbi:MAG TPA: AAA family ATPase [Thermoanaerobaculia bacterium]|nr:AAA family ATPase [Thermoanaerobaculia bacterium]